MRTHETLPYDQWIERSPEEMAARAVQFYEDVNRRRTTRYFSERPVPRGVIETCLLAAGTAPSGANHQPWHFTVIESADIKKKVREAAEEEERVFYQQKAPQEWLDALAPLGTDEEKPFLETAPYLIAIFSQKRGGPNPGDMKKNYYVNESVGIATGILITALHHAGLATLTHTPAPMNFLNDICGRPESEKPFLILVVGYPAPDATVPVAGKVKKPLEQISTWL
ncbi:NADH dehydrogenase [Ensifer adhaerens]|uniref:nitroreductase family protein n=1 Tax=Ensifer adhaerens TaxID=106592 RepID=UPI0015691E15|nr:nitroreductase family protein [Ensifer adhaerens]NRP18173.1 NADH dehydrogenase [Ensifer adhaerens]